jgi:putative two-component system response regulator
MYRMENLSDCRILIVDDQAANVTALETVLGFAGYTNMKGLSDSREAFTFFTEFAPDLVILDLHMPHVDGLGVIDLLAGVIRPDDYLPILVLTGDASAEAKQKALSRGAHDFLSKPLNSAEVLLRVGNLLQTRFLHLQLKAQNTSLENKVQERTAQFADAQVEMLQRLAVAAEYRDDETGHHTQRVGILCAMLASAIGQSEQEVELMRLAAPLHDVGKIGIPDRIFLKPDQLTPAEFEIMKSHTTIGGEILGRSRFPILQLARQIALSHHERWDGLGYPQGIAGYMIPLPGRITAVADVFDALTHARPYKEAWPVEKAMATIRQESGRHFDPTLVTAFVDIMNAGGLGQLAERISAQSEDWPKSRVALIESIR